MPNINNKTCRSNITVEQVPYIYKYQMLACKKIKMKKRSDIYREVSTAIGRGIDVSRILIWHFY